MITNTQSYLTINKKYFQLPVLLNKSYFAERIFLQSKLIFKRLTPSLFHEGIREEQGEWIYTLKEGCIPTERPYFIIRKYPSKSSNTVVFAFLEIQLNKHQNDLYITLFYKKCLDQGKKTKLPDSSYFHIYGWGVILGSVRLGKG